MNLLELVFEGGTVVNAALAEQRKVLAARYGTSFLSASAQRGKIAWPSMVPDVVLVRGMSRLEEVVEAYPKARIIIDALGRPAVPEPRSFGSFAFRVQGVLTYCDTMRDKVRAAGVGRIKLLPGPLLAPVEGLEKSREGETLRVGVTAFGRGHPFVAQRLRQMREERKLNMEIYAVEGTVSPTVADHVVSDPFELGAVADVLCSPSDTGEFWYAPHEAGILALAMGCVLVTPWFGAVETLPLGKACLRAESSNPGSHVNAVYSYFYAREKYAVATRPAYDASEVENTIIKWVEG